jgi:hypothetical protein
MFPKVSQHGIVDEHKVLRLSFMQEPDIHTFAGSCESHGVPSLRGIIPVPSKFENAVQAPLIFDLRTHSRVHIFSFLLTAAKLRQSVQESGDIFFSVPSSAAAAH